MKKVLQSLLLFTLLCAAFSGQAKAQATFLLGPRVGLDFGDNFDGDFMIGADARISTFALPVILNPALDYILIDADNASAWHLDLNALFPFGIDNQLFTPYAGAGLGITRVSIDTDTPLVNFDTSETDAGLNVVGGAVFGFGGFRPFVQARIKLLGDIELFTVQGGLLFGLGG